MSKFSQTVLHKGKSRTKELRVPTKSCLGTTKGWLDVSEKFKMTPPDVRREDYFRICGRECFHRLDGAIISNSFLSSQLRDLEYINKPYMRVYVCVEDELRKTMVEIVL